MPHRFYVGDDLLASGMDAGDVQLGGDAAHRIARVLRLRRGDPINLIGDGREFEAVLEASSPRVIARLIAELPVQVELPALTLYQGLIRPNRFEWLIEKGTEVGVTAFVPILTQYTAVRASEIGAARLDRWRRIAVEAMEQSGRRRPPQIAPPAAYTQALAAVSGVRVFAWEGLRSQTIDTLDAVRRQDGPISLFIGPEGGWSEAEVDAARSAGAIFLGLGAYTLRAETAAIIAVALLRLT